METASYTATLGPGSLLYIPRGWAHVATAQGEEEEDDEEDDGDKDDDEEEEEVARPELGSIHLTFALHVQDASWLALLRVAVCTGDAATFSAFDHTPLGAINFVRLDFDWPCCQSVTLMRKAPGLSSGRQSRQSLQRRRGARRNRQPCPRCGCAGCGGAVARGGRLGLRRDAGAAAGVVAAPDGTNRRAAQARSLARLARGQQRHGAPPLETHLRHCRLSSEL